MLQVLPLLNFPYRMRAALFISYLITSVGQSSCTSIPGCTAEACNFRDDYSQYQQAGVVILGVSPDSPAKHTKFIAKYQLPFTLLSDVEHQVCELYGVWGRKKFMG